MKKGITLEKKIEKEKTNPTPIPVGLPSPPIEFALIVGVIIMVSTVLLGFLPWIVTFLEKH